MRRLVVPPLLCLLLPVTVQAGMPGVTLTEIARLRLQTISLFVFGVLISAALICLVWNWVQRDFPTWPRLSFVRSLGLTCLWGLLCGIVLTMISGARELLTPGAWEKQGLTYRLADQTKAESLPQDARRQKIEVLRTALLSHAAKHNGKFPDSLEALVVPRDVWTPSPPTFAEYAYFPGRSTQGEVRVLACESADVAGVRYAVFTDGSIEPLPPPRPAPRNEAHSP